MKKSLILLGSYWMLFVGLWGWLVTPTSASDPSPYAYVTNKGDNSVSVIDMFADTVVATILVGNEPRWLQISDALDLVYVTNHSSNTVSKISTSINQVVNTISVGTGPCWLELTGSDTILTVANVVDGSASIINTNTDSLIGTIAFGIGALTNWGKPKKPKGLADSSGEQVVIFLNQGIDNVGLVAIPLDTGAPFIDTIINTGTGSAPVWTDVLYFPDSSRSYITLSGSDSVAVLHYPSYQIETKISVGDGPHWIKITPDARFAYVINLSGNSVSKISLTTHQELAEMAVGSSPHFLAITDNSSHVFVPNSSSNNVSVISVATDSVVVNVPVGINPNWVAISPDGTKAYVVNGGSNSVTVISTSTFDTLYSIPVGSQPNEIITRPHHHVEFCQAKPGDANSSGTYSLGDVISIVNYIFNKPGCSPQPLCWLSNLLCRGDWNGSGTVSLADVIRAVNFIFNKPGGPWNALPSGVCCLP